MSLQDKLDASKADFEGKSQGRCGGDRIARPAWHADDLVFLASYDSAYVTGVELFVDGGAGQY